MATRSERRKRRRDPAWHTMRDLLDDGTGGAQPEYVAHVLYGAGYDSPEKIRRMTEEEIQAVPYIGRRGKARIRFLRNKLNRGETT